MQRDVQGPWPSACNLPELQNIGRDLARPDFSELDFTLDRLEWLNYTL